MIEAWWLLAVVGLFGVLLYAVAALLLRENRALARALIARTPQELTMLEKAEGRSRPKRRPVPEHEGDFHDRTPRVMGL